MIFLKEYIQPAQVLFLEAADKKAVLDGLLARVESLGLTEDGAVFRKAILDREALLSTGIGVETAIPHVKSAVVRDFFIMIGVCRNGVPWEALDDKPVKLVFLIGGPNDHDRYLRILAKLSLLIKNPQIREQILSAADPDAVCRIFENR